VSAAPPPPPPPVVEEIRRLVGHAVEARADGGYVITDVAGEGRPLVGIVERRGAELWIVPTDADEGIASLRLSGPLASPRIAGPRYKVWVLGTIEKDGSLRPRRLGVLARPPPKGNPP
jgi:hypothetical protein